MECKTVRVVSPKSDENPQGFIVINESDLTDEHELFVEDAGPASSDPAEPPPEKTKAPRKPKAAKAAGDDQKPDETAAPDA